MKGNSKKEKVLIVIGSLFILIGMICNEWVLVALFSPDGVIASITRIKIWSFDLLMILIGFLVVRYRNRISFSRANLALLILSTVISLIIGEILIRVFLPARAPFERRFPVGIVRKPLPYTMFGGTPNGKLDSSENLNSKGYRGKEPLVIKKPHEYRIFMLGGSTVFAGSPPIASLLEDKFKKNNLKNLNVFNYGVVSSVSGMELARIVFEISELSPDLIVMYNGCNDIMDRYLADPRPGYPFTFIAYENNPLLERNVNKYPVVSLLAYGSGLLRYFFPHYFVNKFAPLNQTRKDVGYNSEEWRKSIAKIYVGNLLKAHKISKSFGADFIAFFQPVVYFKDPLSTEEKQFISPAARDYCVDMRERILHEMEIAKQNSRIKIIDLSDIYDNIFEWTFRDYVHTRQESKIIVAKEMYKHINNYFGLKMMKESK